MKLFLFTAALIFSVTILAQSPEAINYQGIARNSTGVAYSNQSISLRISILEGGVSGTLTYQETHTAITNQFGLFTVQIGNGTVTSGAFNTIDWGNGIYFVEVEMDENGGTSYQSIGTSQLISVPYALHAKTVDNDLVDDADADPTNELNATLTLNGTNLELIDAGGTLSADLSTLGGNTLDQAYDQGGAGAGANIVADAGAVGISTNGSGAIALDVDHTNTGVGISVSSTNAGNTFSAVQATTNSNSAQASAIIGNTDGAAWGVSGQATATSTASAAVYGSNLRTNGGHGVLGIGHNGTVGQTNYQLGFGIYGQNFDAIGPLGNAVGTYGIGYIGVWGDNNGAGGYSVYANGDLGASGTKTFSIDHPADPSNKYLRHFSIESNEVLNVYRGTITTDANGEATVILPEYFDLINTNFSYHLTPIGGAAQVYVKQKITGNTFVLAGAAPNMEVSWIVYAERNDPYLQHYPEKRTVEVEKESWNQGKYLLPELYNQPENLRIVQPLQKTEQTKINLKEEK